MHYSLERICIAYTAGFSVSYQANEKLICQQTRRATTIPRPLLESSWRVEENPDLPGIFLCDPFSHLFSK